MTTFASLIGVGSVCVEKGPRIVLQGGGGVAEVGIFAIDITRPHSERHATRLFYLECVLLHAVLPFAHPLTSARYIYTYDYVKSHEHSR